MPDASDAGAVPDDPNATFADLGLDSLAVVEVQLAVQQRFGFTVPDEDARAILTLGSAVDYVNARLGAAPVA
jgi:acyl carrier protein